jgi:hypothetical protein
MLNLQDLGGCIQTPRHCKRNSVHRSYQTAFRQGAWHHEKNISAQQNKTGQKARIPSSDVHQGGPQDHKAAQGQGEKTFGGLNPLFRNHTVEGTPKALPRTHQTNNKDLHGKRHQRKLKTITVYIKGDLTIWDIFPLPRQTGY